MNNNNIFACDCRVHKVVVKMMLSEHLSPVNNSVLKELDSFGMRMR